MEKDTSQKSGSEDSLLPPPLKRSTEVLNEMFKSNSIDSPSKKKIEVKKFSRAQLTEAATSSVQLAINKSLVEMEMLPKSPSHASLNRAYSSRRLRDSNESAMPFMEITPQDDLLRKIPLVIAVKILSFLGVKELARISITSKQWKTISEDSFFWKPLFKRDFPNLNPDEKSMGSIILRNWKDLYAQFGKMKLVVKINLRSAPW